MPSWSRIWTDNLGFWKTGLSIPPLWQTCVQISQIMPCFHFQTPITVSPILQNYIYVKNIKKKKKKNIEKHIRAIQYYYFCLSTDFIGFKPKLQLFSPLKATTETKSFSNSYSTLGSVESWWGFRCLLDKISRNISHENFLKRDKS